MKYVERCLWDYRANVAMLEILQGKLRALQSVHGHNYEAHVENGASDPVAMRTDKVLNMERKIKRTEQLVFPVNRLVSDLSGSSHPTRQMSEILRLKYFDHNSREYVQTKLSISQPTYWRRHEELMRLARKYFGEE